MQSAAEVMEAFLERVKYYVKISQVSWNIANQVLMDHKHDPCNSFLTDETPRARHRSVRVPQRRRYLAPRSCLSGRSTSPDSLAAIQRLVFDEKKYTMSELLTALIGELGRA